MFANFELWSGGMVEHSTKASLPRSTSGCIPCRRTKKKCDERRPACGRCVRRSQGECTWPRPTSSPSSATGPDDGQQPQDGREATLCTVRPSTDSVLGICATMPGIPPAFAWELMCYANRAIHGAYFDDHYSIFIPLLPLLAEFPSYAYTWLALGAAQLAQQLPSAENPLRLMSLEYHSQAIGSLRQHLHSAPVPQEWALCSMLLLHIFEKFGDGYRSPSDAHVKSARSIFLRHFTHSPPRDMRHILQLESLVYRVAITSTFRLGPMCHLEEYSSLDELLDIWASSPITCGLWQHSLWIGLRPPIFNAVFKLSVLIRLVPLQPSWRSELDKLEGNFRHYLGPYEAWPSHMGDPDHPPDSGGRPCLSLADQARAAHCLYAYACHIITTKLRDPESTQSGDRVRRVSRLGFRLLAYLEKAGFLSPVLIWPATIISLAASSPEDQDIATLYISGLAHKSGSRATTSVMRLLHLAWTRTSKEWPAGTNILFDFEALGEVFI
ncbi:unnamed protein product [Clonostachys rosea f. rosea IK726]|uniref:Uncharacterized protein n=1 Tax=Clonostachys rosea f. rosea IK726 TaxID=1349383 RepID=A0ACA9TXK1_BIOOC|nr:unnamed protein product [Clonostachys rosea f. rosea IK726]